jgi:ribosomal protein L37AE/L43A
MKRLIVESVKVRLLNEVRTLVCINCWNCTESIRIGSLAKQWQCSECKSKIYGLTEQLQDKIINVYKKNLQLKGMSVKNRRLYNNIIFTSEIIKRYGFPGVLVLVAQNLSRSDIQNVLEVESNFSDRLIEVIIEAERTSLKRRFNKLWS